MGVIIYNGQSSKSFGLEVETFPAYNTPKRKYEKVSVPGRSGDLILDNGGWENVTRSYIVAIGSYDYSYYEMMNKLSNWLHSATTYARLEDSYEPDVFRLATFLEQGSMTNIYNHGGEMNLDFDCKPQRFLKIGEKPIVLTSGISQTVINPTNYPSYPLINIQRLGTGDITITLGDKTITVLDGSPVQMTIDCELMDAYISSGGLPTSQYVKFGNDYPRLESGSTNIKFEGPSRTTVEVIPRWYTL